MSDNVTLPGVGVPVASDEVTTLNGATVAAVQVQRVKPVFGVDGTAQDVDLTHGLPVSGQAYTSTSFDFAVGAVGTAAAVDVAGAGHIAFAIKNAVPASAFTGNPQISFQVSDDGNSWSDLLVTGQDSLSYQPNVFAPAPGANKEVQYVAPLHGAKFARFIVTAGVATNAMRITMTPGLTSPVLAVAIAAPVMLKGTQIVGGFQTQDMKDASRTPWCMFVESVAGAAADTLFSTSVATIPGTAAPAAATQYTVPAGKILRIMGLVGCIISTSTALVTSKIRLRARASGTLLVTDPVLISFPRFSPVTATAAAGEGGMLYVNYADGYELPAGTVFGFTHIESSAAGTIDLMVHGFLY